MCGFVGQLSREQNLDRRDLYRMNNMLIHRGPDDSGFAISESRRWGVGHRRLCVIDPIGGRQPMIDKERGLTLVYNGELYGFEKIRPELERKGYVFRTHSDTEVVLALYAIYGLEMFEHLRGEFAFTLIDEPKGEAILVRDRMGLKPLFYTRVGENFYFASEIKALLRGEGVERQIDPSGLIAAVTVADIPGQTVFKNIFQVRNAHFLRVRLDDLSITQHRYWDAIANRTKDVPTAFEDQVAAVRSSVDEAIELRLRADVPVGAYLSGGIDSSLVAAVAAKKLDHLDAFALAFEESRRHDEFPFAQQVADSYGNIRLHRIPVTYDDTIRRLPETVWHLERPFGNLHSVAKIMSSQYARDYVVCVLTGDGGDETFCGYSTFWLQDALQKVNYSLPAIKQHLANMRREAKNIGGNRYYLTGGLARRIGDDSQFMVDKLGFRPTDLARSLDFEVRLQGLFNPDFRQQISRSPTEQLVDVLAESMPRDSGLSHMTLLQYVHLSSIVPEYIATIADRSEFAGSVEARPPLFDHKVVELAMGLPPQSKMHGDREKHILREAYKDVVPASVIERRKQAFLAPPAPFRGVAGRALIDYYLSSHAVKDAGIWDPKKILMLRTARKILPRNRLINTIMTVVLTTQILHDQMVNLRRSWK